ncbi:alpha-hydroxy-acid oxidizing enzyme, partial [Pelomonas sp. HMWF004]
MTSPLIEKLPEGLANLADFEPHAQARIDANAWAYLNGGAADEITLRANRAAWDAIKLHPRVLRDLSGGHTRVTLLGRELLHPVLLAPIAYQRLFHADGELAIAHAAAAQGAGVLLSAQASVPMEDVAA